PDFTVGSASFPTVCSQPFICRHGLARDHTGSHLGLHLEFSSRQSGMHIRSGHVSRDKRAPWSPAARRSFMMLNITSRGVLPSRAARSRISNVFEFGIPAFRPDPVR